MDSGTLALLLVGAMAVWLAAWMWACWAWKSSHGTRRHFSELKGRTDELEKRIAGVEALLVSTVGQETEEFCRVMDELMERMEKPGEKKQEPAPKPKPAPKEKLTLSREYCGRYGKGKRRG